MSTPEATTVMLVTSIGFVTGELINWATDEFDANKNQGEYVLDAVFKTRDNHLSTKEDGDVINNSTIITLRNAQVSGNDFGKAATFQLLSLFTDQIIGFSFCELNT